MPLQINSRFAFTLDQPTDVLLQFEAAALPEQSLREVSTKLPETEHFARIAAHDNIGERIWIRAKGRIDVEYSATVQVQRILADLPSLGLVDPHDLPAETVQYLFDSRYCAGDRFQNFAAENFSDTQGGARIDAIRQWISDNIAYTPGSSGPSTDAADSFIARQGICRDFAHVLITLARASTIPARYVACYSPGVTPPDFHAVAEVFLADPSHENGGAWHMVDATGMADPENTAKIGVGRDAADVSFLTTFGQSNFECSEVAVDAV